MKKLIIKILGALFVLLNSHFYSGCNDALDIIQPGELTDEVLFTSLENLEGYLLGAIYANIEPAYAIYTGAVITDELKPGRSSGGQQFQLHRFFMTGRESLVSDIWLTNNRTINRVNRFLNGASEVTPSSEQTEKYNRLLAEARAIRAYAFLELQTYFSTDMKNPDALGAILFKEVPKLSDQLPRNTNIEVHAFIEEDLEFARTILKSSSDHYYVDIHFVNAMAARFNLYRGDYEQAKYYANEVISKSGLYLSQATPIIPTGSDITIGSSQWNKLFYATDGSFNPYRSIWDDSNRGEVIFSLARLPSGVGVSIGSYFNTNSSSITGSPMWGWGRNLFNIFYNTDGDIRRYAYVDPTARIDPNYMNSPAPIDSDQLIIDKYPGKTNTATRNDIKIFRLSEMYFILAECAVESGHYAEARNHIHAIRVARNYKGTAVTPSYSSSTDSYADILKERRVELALEGHRYIDLKRLAAKASVTMDRNPTDDIVHVENLENESFKYTLPIPLNEIAGNPSIQQNPGYQRE